MNFEKILPTSNPKEGGCLPTPPYLTLKSTRLKFSVSDKSTKRDSLVDAVATNVS